jgi:uncharacterized repeat protein (TIGR02543 family)
MEKRLRRPLVMLLIASLILNLIIGLGALAPKSAKAELLTAPIINWTARTANVKSSCLYVPTDQFHNLNWTQLGSIVLDTVGFDNIWNKANGTIADWTYFGPSGMQIQRFHGWFDIPEGFDPTSFYAFRNISDDLRKEYKIDAKYSVIIDNEMMCFVYPFIDQNKDGINDMTDGDLTNYEITDSNFMSYFSFYSGTGQATGIFDFNGVKNDTYGPNISGVGFPCQAPEDNTGTIITAAMAAYAGVEILRWEIDLFACDWGQVGEFPIGFIEAKESTSDSVVVINYYFDKIDPSNRIGYFTDKTRAVGDKYNVSPGTKNGELDNYLATAKNLGGATNYVSGVQTGGTLTVEQGLNVINILYTKPRDANVTVHYEDGSGNTIAPDLIGALASGTKLDESGTIIVADGGAGQPTQVMKSIGNYTFSHCVPNGGLTLTAGPNVLTLVYDPIQYAVNFVSANASYSGVEGTAATQYVEMGGNVVDPTPKLTAGTFYPEYGQKKFLGWFESNSALDTTPVTFPLTLTTGNVNTTTRTKTLYARWEDGIKVTFLVQNSDYTGDRNITQYVLAGESPANPNPDLLKPGTLYPQYGNKKFLGWFTDPTSGTQFNFGTGTVTVDTTLYGHWEQHWTVSFANTNGNTVQPQTVPNNGKATEPSVLIPQNFRFFGWSTSPTAAPAATEGDNDAQYDFDTPITADTTIYGVWNPSVFSVTFDVNGGDWDTTGLAPDILPRKFEYVPANTSGTYGSAPFEYDARTFTVKPVRVGYKFDVWSPTPTTEPHTSGNATYYAQWEVIDYDIDYIWSDSTAYPVTNPTLPDSAFPETYNVLSTFPLPIGNPTRNGYTFIGYTSEYSDFPYTPIQIHPTEPYSIKQGGIGNVTLTAYWDATQYDITYNLDGGVNNSANPTIYTANVTPLPIANPTKTNYNFTGWTATGGLTITAETKNLAIAAGTFGNIALTAHWAAADFNITYILDGGVNDPENPQTYTVEDAFSIANPTRTNHNFTGWTATGGLTVVTEIKDLAVPLGTFGAITLTAHWAGDVDYPSQSPTPTPTSSPDENPTDEPSDGSTPAPTDNPTGEPNEPNATPEVPPIAPTEPTSTPGASTSSAPPSETEQVPTNPANPTNPVETGDTGFILLAVLLIASGASIAALVKRRVK